MADADAIYTVDSFTASDGYCWRYRRYLARQGTERVPPRAHVVCLHGVQSHAGWFDYSCTKLSQAGFEVSFLDRRGSGMNQEGRGDAPSYVRLLADVSEFLKQLRTTSAGLQSPLPIFVVAISWGGKIATALERWQPGCADGLVLLCPGFFPRVRLPWRTRLGIAWARLRSPERLFSIPLNDPELFTASSRWQDFLRSDSRSLHRATARFLIESIRLDHYLRGTPNYVRVPVLLLLAEKDRIIDNAATRRFVEKFAGPDKQVLEYAGAHHTLEFEPDPDRFLADVQAWLETHLSACPPKRGQDS